MLKVLRAVVLVRAGYLDVVTLYVEGPSPVPAVEEPFLKIEVAINQGRAWCVAATGVEPEVISAC
jgi:hypothetical protein